MKDYALVFLACACLAACARDNDSEAMADAAAVGDGGTLDASATDAGLADAQVGGTLWLRYRISNPDGGDDLTCAQAKAMWAYVTLVDGPEKPDFACDDQPVSFEGLAYGTYLADVVIWDQELWAGSEEIVHADDGNEMVINLELIEAPGGGAR